MATDVRGISARSSEITVDPVQMQEILARALLPTAGSTVEVSECRVVSSRQHDGAGATVIVARRNRDESQGSVLYDLTLIDRKSGETSERRVTGLSLGGMRTRRLWESTRASVPADDQLSAGHLRPYAYVPELDLLLQVFPNDIRLPAVARLIPGADAEIAAALAGGLGPGEWQVTSWTAETIQYRPDIRAIIRLDIQFADEASGQQIDTRYYAKVYREAEPARLAFHVQSEIYDAVQRAGAGVSVAKPTAYIAGLNTTITSAIPGTSLSMLIREGGDVETAARSAARAMAAFHQLHASVPLRSSEEDLRHLRDAQDVLHSRRPDLDGQVTTIIDAVADSLATAPSQLVHGDLKPEHFLIDGNMVGLIDLDFSALADPITDVAYLMTLLGRLEERSRRWGEAAGVARRAFLDEYFLHVPASWRTRLGVHHAMMSVQKAGSLSQQAAPNGEEDLVASIISEGQALLTNPDATIQSPSFKRRPNRTANQRRNAPSSSDR
jgi:hypothetical protein